MGKIYQKQMGEEQYGIQGAYVITAISIGLYILSGPFFNYLLRRRLMDLGQWNEDTHRQLTRDSRTKTDNLKWGLILLFAGIGLIIDELLPYSFYKSSLPYGVLAVSTSIGFLLYYGIVSRNQQS